LTVWERYRYYVVGAAVVVAVQTAMIVGLVVQRARRRQIELALRESERQFRETAERNHNLAGHLIHAQEEERSRIARDLHDDLSQHAASLSIMLSSLKQRMARGDGGPAIDDALAALQHRSVALANGIRNLSHRLHPSVLEHTGLVATLQSLCAEVEKDHDVEVRFSADSPSRAVDGDLALCLFRVAQEALANAVRHGHPRAIAVHMKRAGEEIELSVFDNGVGFRVGERAGSGLGLRSINERVRLLGGRFTVESDHERGTRLRAVVPASVPLTSTDTQTVAADRRPA
jgi:signal transduction histidine kinase